MTMHEFWESFPAWEVIVLIVYGIVLTVYFFATMIVAVDDDDIPEIQSSEKLQEVINDVLDVQRRHSRIKGSIHG